MPNLGDVHYVKFLRGSIGAWENLLQTPNKIDDDTLYFIYESSANTTEGKLYLGKKLISGSGSTSINDIGDIYIDDQTLADKQILVYNETSEQWENTSLSTIISSAVGTFVGASDIAPGIAGLVPVPQVGDQGKFLRGDGAWAAVNIPTFDPNVFNTNSNSQITLAGFVSAPVGSLMVKTQAGIEWANVSVGSISRTIITNEDLDDLIEAGTANPNTIYMVLADEAGVDNLYNEYLIINGEKELIGTLGDVDLTNYVTNSTFQTAVGNINSILNDSTQNGTTVPGLVSKVSFLETKVGNLNDLIFSAGNSTMVQEINTINDTLEVLSDRLQWHDLIND